MRLPGDLILSHFGKNKPMRSGWIISLICVWTLTGLACNKKDAKEHEREEESAYDIMMHQAKVMHNVQSIKAASEALEETLASVKVGLEQAEYEALLKEQEDWEKGDKIDRINALLKEGVNSTDAYRQAIEERKIAIDRAMSIRYLKENHDGMQGYYEANAHISMEVYQWDKNQPRLDVILSKAASRIYINAQCEIREDALEADCQVDADDAAQFTLKLIESQLTVQMAQDWTLSTTHELMADIPELFTLITENE